MKILIVEDELIYRRMVKKSLLEAGYEIVEADGLAAWGLFQNEPYHLVVTDWMMLGLDRPAVGSKNSVK